MTELRDHLMALADKAVAAGEGPRQAAPHPVNDVMISHWTEAMGDRNPVYAGPDAVAPPVMIQVWSMEGLSRDPAREFRRPMDDVFDALDEAGYKGVVATNCEHTYHRYLSTGEELTSSTRMVDMVGPKRTALGEGYFVTWNVTWFSGDEPVAEMMFRLLKFQPVVPAEKAKREPYPLRPAVNDDTRFFWDGVQAGELRIQRCGGCGELRHPPGPVCPSCRSAERTHIVASGAGTVYSYVVHHHPPVPGQEPPFVVAVVELPEGVRMVGNIVQCPIEEVYVGMPVRVTYQEMDDELTLPMWAPIPEEA
ncbi:bifunctional MaoC family dehydratase N-terminal/OB-fold nucleic acid binding domain-containing protein [Planotetraspora kaengkrachanensis]|uniref:DNA-binding protein n=1 Tax=Planotetraspora kaengkrachanensis TaxID=575193 RepID=A0A8J3Q119_9ACTN|nr:bifunctional MaoC family dehydratase N-terminal/OB-fold nucleic acid binding domain-containing protein [Planotetraspora kaengkrachanensis]GIG84750.1 DNA-binding protein [Planotetraspora kaengkrachanensis]